MESNESSVRCRFISKSILFRRIWIRKGVPGWSVLQLDDVLTATFRSRGSGGPIRQPTTQRRNLKQLGIFFRISHETAVRLAR
jgi:hypothetical protein